jgi:WD40 repeat protein/serine/threonine protein kinase
MAAMNFRPPSEADPLDAVVESFLQRYRRGERPSVTEYVERYPELAGRIRETFPALAMVEELGSVGRPAAAIVPPDAAVATGRLGDYRLLRIVGSGGMGVVYEAVQESLGRHVALKVLPPSLARRPLYLERFQREAKAAARLHHTNIVPVYGVGEENGTCYYAMQFIHGQGLEAVLEDVKRLRGVSLSPPAKGGIVQSIAHGLLTGSFVPASTMVAGGGVPAPAAPAATAASTSGISGEPEARYFRSIARLGLQAAEGLAHAHGQGVWHRDIKPSNLLLDAHGTLWITDFGLAKAEDSDDLTHTGDIVGTIRYMAPERFKGKADARSDVYALAVTLYELLALRPPFSGRDQAELIGQITGATSPPLHELAPAIPRDLETIVAKAMARDPELRYATAQALADDLRAFLDHRPIQARRASALEQLRRWCRRNPLAACLAATVMLLLLMVAAATSSGYVITKAALKQAQQDREQAIDNYYDSLVGEARALRLARVTGYREQAWKLLDSAHQLVTPKNSVAQLRQEAVACMGDSFGWGPTILEYAETEQVQTIAFGPDAAELATGLSNGTVSLCNLATQLETARLPRHPSPVTALACTTDGKLWASADLAGAIKVSETHDGRTWTLRTSIAADPPSLDWDHQRVFLAITPDDKEVFSCSAGASAISLWDLRQGTRIAQFPVPDGQTRLHSLALSTDGMILAAGYSHPKDPGGILLWDLPSRQRRPIILSCRSYPRQIAFSPDGLFLASACGDGGVLLYDTKDFQRRLSFGSDFPIGVRFSPDSRLLAITYNQSGVTRLLDVASSREVAVLRHPGQPHSVAFSKDGKRLVTANARTIRCWNLAGSGEKIVLAGHDGGVPDLAFSPDDKLLASAGKDGLVKIWDPRTGEARHTLTSFRGHPVGTVAFSPDGRMLAAADWNATIRIWEVGSWRELATSHHEFCGEIWQAAFSPDGQYFAVCGDPGGVVLWRVAVPRAKDGKIASLELQRMARLSKRAALHLAFSPDSRLLAWVEWSDASLHFWDLANSRTGPLWTTRLGDGMNHVAFQADSRHVLFVGPAQVPEIWSLASGQKIFDLTGEGLAGTDPTMSSGHIIVSADGRWLAQASPAIRIWDLQAKKLLLVLPEERSPCYGLAWSPSKDFLAVGLSDGTIAIWNLPKIQSQLSEISLAW